MVAIPKPLVLPVEYSERMFFDTPASHFAAPDYSTAGKVFRPELQNVGVYGKPMELSYDTGTPPKLVVTYLPDPELIPTY